MAEWLKAIFIFLRGPQKHESPFPLFSSFSHLWREEIVVDDKCQRINMRTVFMCTGSLLNVHVEIGMMENLKEEKE